MTVLTGTTLACSDDTFSRVQGELKITAINAPERVKTLRVNIEGPDPGEEQTAAITYPETIVVYEALVPGTWEVKVRTRDATGTPVQSFIVTQVLVRADQRTEIVVDLAEPPPVFPEVCDGVDNDRDNETDEGLDLPICVGCIGGEETQLEDDPRCGEIDCDGFDRFALKGINTAEGESSCVMTDFADITSHRCTPEGACIVASLDTCSSSERIVATAGVCHTIANCEAGSPVVATSPDGTPCAPDKICRSGVCRLPDPPAVGCADGEREGFLDTVRYPDIAGCSGAWSVPGVTRSDMAPTCARNAGDDSSNAGGAGCAAVDLCLEGWHICGGKEEVARRAGSCDDATPPNAPNKSLFFAVSQTSVQGSKCSDSGDNDVFGCGNLGTMLAADKNCAPLTRVLASTSPNVCGYNEGEPPHGPWECKGDSNSHYHEGALVTKSACVNASCSYDGYPVGPHDKGGVLCCRD